MAVASSLVRSIAMIAMIAGFAGLGLAPLRAQTTADLARSHYKVDGMHSSIGFVARLLGVVKVRGRFQNYRVAVTYDSAHVERSSVTAIIDSKSIDTDMDFRDTHLKSPDFFDVATYPTIEFQSDRVTPQADGVLVAGSLTMHGVTRPISFMAHITSQQRLGRSGNTGVELEAALRLSRTDFGIAGTNKFNPDYNPATNLLSDSVDIVFELDAQREGFGDRRLGEGTPPGVADTVNKMLERRGIDAAMAGYRRLRATRPTAFNFDEDQLDILAHQLATHGNVADALALARLNADQYPTRAPILETLGATEALAGHRDAALAAYRRAALRNPRSASAKEMIRRLADVEGT